MPCFSTCDLSKQESTQGHFFIQLMQLDFYKQDKFSELEVFQLLLKAGHPIIFQLKTRASNQVPEVPADFNRGSFLCTVN